MTASEFAFLAMGLILGVAAGAALVEFVRARPPAPREIRVTVSPDAVPRRRASTLANDAFTESPVAVDPAAGGPADQPEARVEEAVIAEDVRTPVLPPGPASVAAAFRLAPPAARSGGVPVPAEPQRAAAQGVPVSSGIDPMLTALRASAAASAEAAMAAAGRPVATAVRPGAGAASGSGARAGAASGNGGSGAATAVPRGDRRRSAHDPGTERSVRRGPPPGRRTVRAGQPSASPGGRSAGRAPRCTARV